MHMFMFCWRIAAGNVIHIFLIKDVFLPLIPPVIDQDGTFFDPSHLINGLRSTHTEGRSSAPPPPPPPQFNISVFCHMQSNRVVDGTDNCTTAEGPAADDKIPVPSATGYYVPGPS